MSIYDCSEVSDSDINEWVPADKVEDVMNKLLSEMTNVVDIANVKFAIEILGLRVTAGNYK